MFICASAWEREVKNINRIYKKLHYQDPASQRHHRMKIVNMLKKIGKIWNLDIFRVKIPMNYK
ncbi:hypothetical protein DICPUDRAFT_158511 [Dictyostelium purpureum]|uniref:Uncharacterized protein n=1 Tax=Dictyostelium purpureum TaxID=5786 RepID=F1A1S7_DICPU|nr:uncharacterized protein DICPUDRAFT_158511 [Dictyostelium purpureum]EGC29851.1 hypothetical protein DICPUDRAFT_158511 [Dictyostelium purpureum]|eukprot:XP_003293625.1 hypothetical protein DICPUDRAFT_158511 [Dictyostelium purpureum]